MGVGWIVGFLIAAVPVLFNRWDSAAECEFDEIFHSWYMAGVITPMFSAVWFCMLFVYWRIWREAAKQVKQLRTTGLQKGSSDWKSVQVTLIYILSLNWIIMHCYHLMKNFKWKSLGDVYGSQYLKKKWNENFDANLHLNE